MADPAELNQLNIRTLVAYFAGRRQAILTVAECRQSLWIGLAFVASAGLARDYDSEFFPYEPWYLVLPVAASLVVSGLLFGLIRLTMFRLKDHPGIGRMYRSFLTCFWMTAPIAWLYAIPFERLLANYQATVVNLWILAIVSLWRVFLITRVICVLYRTAYIGVFFIVMLLVDILAILAALFSPKPIFNLMGGISHTPADVLILNATHSIIFFGFITLLVWLIGTVITAIRMRPQWFARGREDQTVRVSRSVPLLAGLLILLGLGLSAWTQPQQYRSLQVDRLLRSAQVERALVFMSQYDRSDFPPHFDSRPRHWTGQQTPRIETILENLVDSSHALWVKRYYLTKYESMWPWGDLPDYLVVLADYCEQVPDGSQRAAQWRHRVGSQIPPHIIADERAHRAALKLLELAD